MTVWVNILLPFVLLLARISGFFAVLPIFGWRALPVRVRAGMVLLVTIFFAAIKPAYPAFGVHWLEAATLVGRELLCGLALGLAVRLVFQTAQQGGRIMGRQMGFALAQIIDPLSGERSQPIGIFYEMTFALFFLAVGGHHLLLRIIAYSYKAFPVGTAPGAQTLAEGMVQAGSAMLLFALQLAAPLLAAFLALSVVLAVLARVLPEMNILLMSLPLRVGLGLFMAAAAIPMLRSVTSQLAGWMGRILAT